MKLGLDLCLHASESLLQEFASVGAGRDEGIVEVCGCNSPVAAARGARGYLSLNSGRWEPPRGIQPSE